MLPAVNIVRELKVGQKFEKGCKSLTPVDILNGVWHKTGIDLITNLPETPEGYNTIVAMINNKSKWVKAAPLTSKHAYQVAHFMYSTMCRWEYQKFLLVTRAENSAMKSLKNLQD